MSDRKWLVLGLVWALALVVLALTFASCADPAHADDEVGVCMVGVDSPCNGDGYGAPCPPEVVECSGINCTVTPDAAVCPNGTDDAIVLGDPTPPAERGAPGLFYNAGAPDPEPAAPVHAAPSFTG